MLRCEVNGARESARLDDDCVCCRNEDADASDGSIIGSVNDDWIGLVRIHSALGCLIVGVGGEERNGNGRSRARLDGESVGGSDGDVGAYDGGEGEKS